VDDTAGGVLVELVVGTGAEAVALAAGGVRLTGVVKKEIAAMGADAVAELVTGA
jgi:hypothetical protein